MCVIKCLLSCGILLSASVVASAGTLRVASPIADNMVLQRDRPVVLWGEASPGETVTVSFADQVVRTTASTSGAWRVSLAPLPASKEGRILSVSSASGSTLNSKPSPLNFTNVVVGEVWLAAGQSNMEVPLWSEMPRYRDEHGAMIAQVTHLPNVRFGMMMCPWKESSEPRAYTRRPFRWLTAEPKNLRASRVWSAISFWFARELTLALDVPVGVIGLYQGGTRIEQWTPGSSPDGKQGGLFNEQVAPFAPYSVRGLLWYQGCANAGDTAYAEKMHALYRGWTNAFENAAMPIYFVQVPDHGAPLQLRQAKFAAEEPHAGMVVINDVGNPTDEHPARKEIVAQRLALHALKRDYGFSDVTADSPTVASAVREGSSVRLTFANAKLLYVYNDDRSMPDSFEVAGPDGAFRPATVRNLVTTTNATGFVQAAYLGGETKTPELVVGADGVVEPKRVRYLFKRPARGSVFSEVNLPLGAFEVEVR